MADYININGNNIPIRASDPTNPITGEIWYNTTTNALKGQGLGTSSWASIPSLSQFRRAVGGGGNKTSAIVWGGDQRPPGTLHNPTATEEYDGTSWTGGGPLNSGRSVAITGAGTQTTAIAAGGTTGLTAPETTTQVEEYSGTAWTTGTALPQKQGTAGLVGTQTAASFAGGGPGGDPGAIPLTTHLGYDGSTWTSRTALPAGRSGWKLIGADDDFFGFGGPPTGSAIPTLYWNGSTWTSNTAYPQGVANIGGAGNFTNGLAFGGANPPGLVGTVTNTWDGTSWASDATMNIERSAMGNPNGATTSIGNSFAAAGATTSEVAIASAEDYTAAGPVTVTFSSS